MSTRTHEPEQLIELDPRQRVAWSVCYGAINYGEKGMNEHRCDTCRKNFETCDGKNITFGIDEDPSAIGADADVVLECDEYEPSALKRQAIREQQAP